MKTEVATVSIVMKNSSMVCSIQGDIDHHSARSVRMKIDDEFVLRRPARLVLDVSSVEFMDSSGLGLILGRYNKAAEIGAECVLSNPNENIMKILDLAGIGRLVRIERSKDDYAR